MTSGVLQKGFFTWTGETRETTPPPTELGKNKCQKASKDSEQDLVLSDPSLNTTLVMSVLMNKLAGVLESLAWLPPERMLWICQRNMLASLMVLFCSSQAMGDETQGSPHSPLYGAQIA